VTRNDSLIVLPWEVLADKIKLFSKISRLVCWIYILTVYHYPSWAHTNYKHFDAASALDKRALESFATEYDANFTTTQKEMTIVIIRSMFVKQVRNKLSIHVGLRKKCLIVSLILALREAYARSSNSRSSRIKVIAEDVVYNAFCTLKIIVK